MLRAFPPSDEIERNWIEYKADPSNIELRNRLIERYLPLVKHIARQVVNGLPNGVELGDLVAAGVFGLIAAIDAFDLSRGIRFESYSARRIRGAMVDQLRANDWVPRLVRSRATKLAAATRDLDNQLGRQPTLQELAKHLGLSLDEVEALVADAHAVHVISLNKRSFENDTNRRDVAEIDTVADRRAEDPTQRARSVDLMRCVTRGLNKSERLIIILYYYEELTMKEIGDTLGLSESRVSQMHKELVSRLRVLLEKRRLDIAA